MKKIIEGRLSTQLIDTREKAEFDAGHIVKATNLPWQSVMQHHSRKDLHAVQLSFKVKGLDTSKAMVFTGGDGAYAMKAVFDDLFYPTKT